MTVRGGTRPRLTESEYAADGQTTRGAALHDAVSRDALAAVQPCRSGRLHAMACAQAAARCVRLHCDARSNHLSPCYCLGYAPERAIYNGRLSICIDRLSIYISRLSIHIGRLHVHIGRLRIYIGRLRICIGRLRIYIGRLRVCIGRLHVYIGRLRIYIRLLLTHIRRLCIDIGLLHAGMPGLRGPIWCVAVGSACLPAAMR
jgi:hypothetical protein